MNLNALRAYTNGTSSVPAGIQPHDPNTAAATAGPKSSGLDSFEHTVISADEAAYAGTTYTSTGETEGEPERFLPDRYYNELSKPHIGYHGSMVSYAEVLEEAVSTGQMTLDEEASVWSNYERAEKILILDKVKPLFPWSSRCYTEDGQYVCRVENGQVTGMRLACYYDQNGRKITAQSLAEQLASGVPPTELDGDYSFLHDVDPELYFKALEIGNAHNKAEQALDQYERGDMTDHELEDELGPLILLLFGRDGHKLTLRELRRILEADDFGPQMLKTLGTLPEDWSPRQA